MTEREIAKAALPFVQAMADGKTVAYDVESGQETLRLEAVGLAEIECAIQNGHKIWIIDPKSEPKIEPWASVEEMGEATWNDYQAVRERILNALCGDQSDMKPVNGKSAFVEIQGKWPGDETAEELLAALKEPPVIQGAVKASSSPRWTRSRGWRKAGPGSEWKELPMLKNSTGGRVNL